MSGYVKESCLSSSSKNGCMVPHAAKIITVGGISKGVRDSPHRGGCWARHMHKIHTPSQTSLHYVSCHVFHAVIISQKVSHVWECMFGFSELLWCKNIKKKQFFNGEVGSLRMDCDFCIISLPIWLFWGFNSQTILHHLHLFRFCFAALCRRSWLTTIDYTSSSNSS